MHHYTTDTDVLAAELLSLAQWRMRLDPIPLGTPRRPADLAAEAGPTITAEGLGGQEALRVFRDVLAPACLSPDYPRYLAFVPSAPTEVAVLFDLLVGAYSIYGGSWLEGAGAVHAENDALRWLAQLAGMPPTAGGCFVAGGTMGNLSALVAARDSATRRRRAVGRDRPDRWALVAGPTAHSSIASAATVLDADVLVAEPDEHGRLSGPALRKVLAPARNRVFAVVATAGSTNLGIIDDLASVADVCAEQGVWLHVDGAYGGAGLAAPSIRRRFDGVERADSLIVDPHKWLFAPFDACALIYARPEEARMAHAQHAGYLDVLTESGDWNPSDYAVHLTRRARGLPFWFSLATHGTEAYAAAVEQTLAVAAAAAESIRARPELVELVAPPSLSVVVFRRLGWAKADYLAWSEAMLRRGEAFVVPTTHQGETVLRFCIVNPRTTIADVDAILDSLA